MDFYNEEQRQLDSQSGVNDPVYEPDMRNFKVTIEYNGKKIDRVYQYDANEDLDSNNTVMVSVVGDMMADSLEDMLETITK